MKKLLAIAILATSIQASAANLDTGIRALYSGDFATALKEIQPLAIDGNADAQFRLCGMYFLGQGVPKNDFEAANFCKLAAQQGHVEAMYNLGLFYQNGEGVGQDLNEASRWYNAAALRGHQNAQVNLNELKQHISNALAANPFPTNPQPVMQPAPAPQPQYAVPVAVPVATTQRDPANDVEKYCLIAAQRGNPDPSCLDSSASQPTSLPAPKEHDLNWYIAESKKGNLQAKNNLGVMYRRGQGAKKDPAAAFKLFEQSAAKGSVHGMMNLASMYKNGEGVAQNLELAYAWYNLSADRSLSPEQKTRSQESVREIAKYLSNEQIGNALNYVTKLDDSIPILNEE